MAQAVTRVVIRCEDAIESRSLGKYLPRYLPFWIEKNHNSSVEHVLCPGFFYFVLHFIKYLSRFLIHSPDR